MLKSLQSVRFLPLGRRLRAGMGSRSARAVAVVLLIGSLPFAGLLAKELQTNDSPSSKRSEPAAPRGGGKIDTAPVRETSGLVLQKGEWKYECMECHRGIKAKWHYDRPMIEHRDLRLRHGNNRFCLNCHHPTNRNVYVDYDGSEISAEHVELLCAKCHGPQHRDWKAGVHGRINGYWDTSAGAQERLVCIQCHDPHDPGFKAIKPLSPPTYPARAAGSRPHHADATTHP